MKHKELSRLVGLIQEPISDQQAFYKFVQGVNELNDLDELLQVLDHISLPEEVKPEGARLEPNIAGSCFVKTCQRMAEIFVEEVLAARSNQESRRIIRRAIRYFQHPLAATVLSSTMRKRLSQAEANGGISLVVFLRVQVVVYAMQIGVRKSELVV
jgi:hypothetical protein